jgi:hypothetical protein
MDGYWGVTGKWRRHDEEVLLWGKTGSAEQEPSVAGKSPVAKEPGQLNGI